MKPTIGRIVHVLTDPGNGSDTPVVATAIITAVGVMEQRVPEAPTAHMGQLVHLYVFPPGGDGYPAMSVPLYADRAEAEAADEECVNFLSAAGQRRHRMPHLAFWPPREPIEAFREVSKAQMAYAARNL